MTGRFTKLGVTTMRLSASLMALIALRYFFPALLRPPEVQLVARHSFWVLLHIGPAALAIAIGPFQFVAALRDARRRLHRGLGYVYVTCVLLSGLAGLRLSPDTATFFAQSMTHTAATASPDSLAGFVGYRAAEVFTERELWPAGVSFFLLSVTWLTATGMALAHARQRRFALHRAWMLRSYSLTFGGVTIRLLSLVLVLLLRQPLLAGDVGTCSWPLNLLVAEYIIRAAETPASVRANAAS